MFHWINPFYDRVQVANIQVNLAIKTANIFFRLVTATATDPYRINVTIRLVRVGADRVSRVPPATAAPAVTTASRTATGVSATRQGRLTVPEVSANVIRPAANALARRTLWDGRAVPAAPPPSVWIPTTSTDARRASVSAGPVRAPTVILCGAVCGWTQSAGWLSTTTTRCGHPTQLVPTSSPSTRKRFATSTWHYLARLNSSLNWVRRSWMWPITCVSSPTSTVTSWSV